MSEKQAAAEEPLKGRAAWRPSNAMLGFLCGAGAAFGWASGLVGALHGLGAGLEPADLALHRYAWLGPILALFVFRNGFTRPGNIGWGKGFALTAFAGPPLALFSYMGFLLVPLGHGAVVQPSSAAVGGLLLTAIFLHERLALTRVAGVLAIVGGLVIYGWESISTTGTSGILGDLSFLAAGLCWAAFGLLLSLWRVDSLRAATVVTVFSFLIYVPIHAVWFGFERIAAAGLRENLLQIFIQGIMSSAGGILLFTRAVALLGPGRAAVFPALVPGFTMAIGYLFLGVVPTLLQLAGFAIVTVGFAFVLKR
jgi:drug/metabolite transporter (DMT)-like permease